MVRSMTVAELIKHLQSLPQDLPIVMTEGRSWGDPETEVVEPGALYNGMITFDARTVVIA